MAATRGGNIATATSSAAARTPEFETKWPVVVARTRAQRIVDEIAWDGRRTCYARHLRGDDSLLHVHTAIGRPALSIVSVIRRSSNLKRNLIHKRLAMGHKECLTLQRSTLLLGEGALGGHFAASGPGEPFERQYRSLPSQRYSLAAPS
jgi:hypothetical protein